MDYREHILSHQRRTRVGAQTRIAQLYVDLREISDEIDQSYAHGRAPEEQDGPFWPRWEISGSDDESCGELGEADNEQMKAKRDSGHGPEEARPRGVGRTMTAIFGCGCARGHTIGIYL